MKMAETTAIHEIPDYPRGVTFEEVWAGIKELEKQIKETDRIVRRNGRQMGDLHRHFGQLAEHLVAPNIYKRFNERGYNFCSVVRGNVKIIDEQGNTLTEIDIILDSGEILMAVEVKSGPVFKDINHHIKRLEILKEHGEKIMGKRRIQGAIAGAIFGEEEKKAVLEAGLFVIEQSGDTMKIEVPQDFVPREF
jgi:hypothetical protein